MLYKVITCFVLVFSYPICLLLSNHAATVQAYKAKGIIPPFSNRAFHIGVWLFVLWYLYLFLQYCFAFYKQCKIRYSPGWSVKAERMGRSVCLAPELSYIDSSRQFCLEIVSQVNSERAEQIPESKSATVSHPQICAQNESNRTHVTFTPFKPLSMTNKGVSHVHGLINLLLVKRQRRDFLGPRSPLSPFTLTGPLNHFPSCNTVMDLALAQRRRRDFIGPRPFLNHFLFADDDALD